VEPISVVIQCFAKTDTLKGLLDSLLCCEGHRDVDLTIWQDSAYGSRREEEFTGAATKVHAFVVDFISEHGPGSGRSITGSMSGIWGRMEHARLRWTMHSASTNLPF